MRRQAQYSIDDKTLEENEANLPPEESVVEKTPRVIYKIKRNAPPERQESKPNFHIKLDSLPQSVSLGTEQSAPLPERVKAPNLLGNLFSHLAPKIQVSGTTPNPFRTGINLFNQQNSNTFLSSTPAPNIFDNKHEATPKGNSLFQNDEDHQSQADSQKAEKKQIMDVDPTKSVAQYKYEESGSVLASAKLLKYKKDDGDLLTDISMILTEEKKDKLCYLAARLSATQHIIFSGVITKNSQIKSIGEASLDVFPFTVEEGKAKRHRLRVQFSDGQSRQRFSKEVLKAIEKGKGQ